MSKAMYYGSAQSTLVPNATFDGVPAIANQFVKCDSASGSYNVPLIAPASGQKLEVVGFGILYSATAAGTQSATLNLVKGVSTAGSTIATLAITAANTGTLATAAVTAAYAKITDADQVRLIVSSTMSAHVGFTALVFYGLGIE